MRVEYFSEPFYHTIVYDYFDENNLAHIKKEINHLESNNLGSNWHPEDEHHKRLYNEFNVDSYMIDNIFENRRHESALLNCITKVYHLTKDGFFDTNKNPFLNFIPDSNADATMLHGYNNGSSYYEHNDKAVLSLLYALWDEPKEFNGGDLMFGDYKPPLKSNCCLIFPSYEMHYVTKVDSEKNGVVRWTLNQRIFMEHGK